MNIIRLGSPAFKMFLVYIRSKYFISLIILTIATILAYHHRLKMYFWYDDYTLMYYSQAKIPIPYPYGPAVYLFDFLKQFFGMDYFGYAVVNIILILCAVYLLYFLSLRLFKSNILACFAALTLTNGYVGHEEVKLFIALGLTTVTALNLFIMTLICFVLYLQRQHSMKLLILTYILFFLTVEIGALRYPFIFLVFILIDWLYSYCFKKTYLGIITRNIIFFSIFFVQYSYKPSRLFLHYPVMYTNETSLSYIQKFDYNITVSVLNTIGSFWNILFPRFFQIKMYLFLKQLSWSLPDKEVILSVIPVFMFFSTMLILVKLLRTNISWFKIILNVSILGIITTLSIYIINVPDPPDKISIVSGIMCIIFLISLLILRIPRSFFIPGFCLILSTNLITYIYTGKMSDYVLDSIYRYLFTNSLIAAFITGFFVSKEMFLDTKKRALAWVIYLMPTSLLIILPFLAGYIIQLESIDSYGTRPVKLFHELKIYIPEVKEKTLIHLEGDDSFLQKLVSDSIIAGTFPSERVFGIQYNTDERKFISLENLNDLPAVMKKNPDLKLENIHSFIYSKDGLHDLSSTVRTLVSGKNEPISIKLNSWDSDSKMTLPLGQTVKSQLQMQIKFEAKGKTTHPSHQGKIMVSWDYDIFTPHKIDQEQLLTIDLDDQWHEYQFKIPAYGRYLRTLSAEKVSFDSVISLSDMRISYLK